MRAALASAVARRWRGITLVETMLALALLLILLAAGVPQFGPLLRSQRLNVATNELLAAVILARSEAIRRGRRVDLVPADGADWSQGWLVLLDGNGNLRADPGEEVLLVHGPVATGMGISSRFSDARPYLSYNAVGRSRSLASDQQRRSGHWLLALGPEQRKLVISFLGRPRTCNPQGAQANC